MSDYRIEKVRRRIRVFLVGGEQIDGDAFLQPIVRYRTGPEAPIELFNDSDPFLPFAVPGEGPLLIAKDRVIRVEYTDDPADTPVEVPGLRVFLELLLTDGTSVSGALHPEVRAERPRVLDFLNAYAGRFVPVMCGDVTNLIHRDAIVRVRERS